MKRRIGAIVLGLALGIFTGLVVGGQAFETTANPGLVNALDSVGKTLFGDAVWSTTIYPPDPTRGTDETVQIDLAADTVVPVRVNVFFPPDPVEPTCRSALQLEVSPAGGVRVFVDDQVWDGDIPIEFESLEAFPPDPTRCRTAGD